MHIKPVARTMELSSHAQLANTNFDEIHKRTKKQGNEDRTTIHTRGKTKTRQTQIETGNLRVRA